MCVPPFSTFLSLSCFKLLYSKNCRNFLVEMLFKSSLPIDKHVPVKCKKCDEIFTMEFMLTYQLQNSGLELC
jgi:RNase P subunit RPR2